MRISSFVLKLQVSVRRSPAENLLTDHELSMCIVEQTNTELQTYLKIKSAMKSDKISPRIEFCVSFFFNFFFLMFLATSCPNW